MPSAPERLQRLNALLDVALEMHDAGRMTWIGALRESDPELANELVAMLEAEQQLAGRHVLDTPVWHPIIEPAAGLAGQAIGAYTLDAPIGKGGMGSVWRAQRSDGRFEGTVAVKFVNLALLDAAGVARFQREGTLLGRLNHPNIARLLDAGVTDSGQPYLVLEYVDGVAIDTYCNTRRLSAADRIRLVLDVLAAVSHAHGNLIVHRDLKPSNILVTADGTVKLLDFGIAKLLHDEADVTGAETLTVDGGRLLTPDFAAPEQVTGEPITTATDVYALGVLLYVLLSGRHPTRMGTSGAEALQGVLSTEPPQLSAAVTTGSDVAQVAAERSATPERLRRYYRGDLGNILARALRKVPAERYASVAAFADDLQRFLRHEPVSARPDSFGYRARKFVRRNRVQVGVGAAAALALLVAGVRERQLRGRAEAEAKKSKAVTAYMVDVFNVADPLAAADSTPDQFSVRRVLDRGAAKVNSGELLDPETEAEFRVTLAQVYANLGVYDSSLTQARAALTQRRTLLGPRHPDVAKAMDVLGMTLLQLGDEKEAEPLLRDALAQNRELVGANTPETALSLEHLATLLQETSRLAEAESLFVEAVAVRARAPQSRQNAIAHASALTNLGVLQFIRGRYTEAVASQREALRIHGKADRRPSVLQAQTEQNLATALQLSGNLDEAEVRFRSSLALKRRLLGNKHPSVTISLNNFTNFLARERGKVAEARPLVEEALALDRAMFGPDHAFVAASLLNFAYVLAFEGKFNEAERVARDGLAMYVRFHGEKHRQSAYGHNTLAAVLAARGDLKGALVEQRVGHATNNAVLGPRHLNTVAALTNVARLERQLGDFASAERDYRAAIEAYDSTAIAHRGPLVSARAGLTRVLVQTGRTKEALALIEPVHRGSVAVFGPTHLRTMDAAVALARTRVALGDTAAGVAHLVSIDSALTALKLSQRTLYDERAELLKAWGGR